METVRKYQSNPLVIGVIAFILGAFVGLVVLGWGLFPVTYSDAYPEHLVNDPGYREDYLRMAIDSFSLVADVQKAQFRWTGLGEDAPELLEAVAASPGTQNPAKISEFSIAVQGQPPSGTGTGAPPPEEDEALGMQALLLLLCGLLLVLAVAVAAVYFIRRQQFSGKGTADTGAAGRPAAPGAAAGEGEDLPLAQFMTTYMAGDDLFDDSFSIDSPAGEFLGECGVGIADTIGVGDPKRVSAFEIWLFDKNDIQTVTKVVMSSHIFADEANRQRLAAKGEPVFAEPGNQVVLETATLQLVARVVDMAYGQAALPANSFFERITLELVVWPKVEAMA
jgi:hypothetical protein